MNAITDKDRRIVERQIGKTPRGLLDIPVRCKYGYPVVLTTKPLIRYGDEFEIFPTLYWLSCPRRVEGVARIESEGYVRKLEKEVSGNPDLKEEYRKAEERYLEVQKSLLTKSDRKFINEKGLSSAISRGIGGIESDAHLKCLHLHLAHHLAGENVLGKLIQERFSFDDCPSGEVRCKKYELETA